MKLLYAAFSNYVVFCYSSSKETQLHIESERDDGVLSSFCVERVSGLFVGRYHVNSHQLSLCVFSDSS